MCEGYMFSIVKVLTKHARKMPRLWMFGALTGVVAPLRCVRAVPGLPSETFMV